MLTNAVSSGFGRLYAAAADDDRVSVRRVEAVERVKPVEPRTLGANRGNGFESRDLREIASQRDALTSGVRAVFEALGGGSPVAAAGSTAVINDPEATGAEDEEATSRSPESEPDPHLDAAILRFMHAVFRSLAEAEGAASDRRNPAVAGTSEGRELVVGAAPSALTGRQQLAARIDAYASRLAKAGAADDPFDAAPSAGDRHGWSSVPSSDPAAELRHSFADALHTVRRDREGASPPATRADLVHLLHRLAQAVNGAPPTVAGLPTSGGLLRERA